MLLAARVADEEVGEPVAVGVRVRDAHPRVRIGGTGAAGPLLEAEAEPGRIRPAPPGQATFSYSRFGSSSFAT